MDPLHVSIDAQLSAASAARTHAESMNTELRAITRKVDDLLDVWKGGAATSYGESWRELHEAVGRIIAELSSIGDGLGASATKYVQTDAGAASAIGGAAGPRLNI